MNHETNTKEIQKLMIDRGLKVSSIAETASVSPSMVSMVIHGKRRSRLVEQIISGLIGKKVEELWPKK